VSVLVSVGFGIWCTVVQLGAFPTGWRLQEHGWQRVQFLPAEDPSETNAAWYFAEPIVDDHGIVAYFGTNITPGERGFLKVGDQQEPSLLKKWNDSSSFYGSSILATSDGTLLEVSEDGIRRWTGDAREPAGSHSDSDSDRRRLLKARSYIPLVEGGTRAVFLDAELGDLLCLTKTAKRYDLRPLTTAKGPAPAGVFDAIADRDGFLLVATASGLVRFDPESGERHAIAAPSTTEEFKTVARDTAGRIWTAGDLLYVSTDDGKRWSLVQMPMISTTYIKRIREVSPGTLAVALYDRGVVFANIRAMSKDILHFPARVLVIRAARAVTGSDSDAGHGSADYSPDVRSSVLPASPPDYWPVRVRFRGGNGSQHSTVTPPRRLTGACLAPRQSVGLNPSPARCSRA